MADESMAAAAQLQKSLQSQGGTGENYKVNASTKQGSGPDLSGHGASGK